jgi:Tol biopolymer transport system component
MNAIQSGQSPALYVTDTNGSVPKLVAPDASQPTGVAPDGKSVVLQQTEGWLLGSIGESTTRPLPGEFPIAWTTDSTHIFTQVPVPGGLTIYKLDLVSGKRELWQTIKPKDQVGLRPMLIPTAITPDGHWIVFNYTTQLGQLYRSDTLK